ncbi:maleylacetoacetate isomerase [Leucothrix arctica]|uniref:Maleylacetoacetate isomerase n=1 Tax=Leucothrix arctica TaxID=1481894 RepID=A0A317CEP8_9GAMM|nr:maleylacetoacetate isomerase [Leucothrix arctica]PWQ94602.1 maleylacetoacetate isomerase [Leucothrix arctica]
MLLYDYFRSTAAYRVRIVLNLKGIDYQTQVINLLQGEEGSSDYLRFNPQGLVPALRLDNGQVLTQSLAICEYLEEVYPENALLPADPIQRAEVRAFAQVIACDIHPLNNLRVLKYLVNEMGAEESTKLTFYRHWVAEGFTALEALLQQRLQSTYCFGDSPTLADVCLVGQMFNARRFECNLSPYPRLVAITEQCEQLDAFQKAAPVSE